MNRLLKIGFQCVGHWELADNKLSFMLDCHSNSSNVLYAFISNGIVKYIGKTTQQLKARLHGYKNPGDSQSTNIKNNANIIKLLKKREAVDIFVLPDNGLLHYGDFHLNFAAGLEDSLISVLIPSWNGGVNANKIANISKGGTSMVVENEQLSDEKIFNLVLEKTYYKSGFFNVKRKFSNLFGSDKDQIEIYTTSLKKSPILGYINRTAQNNASPRIMGGVQLRNWFQCNFNEMDIVRVDVLSPVSIIIQAPNN